MERKRGQKIMRTSILKEIDGYDGEYLINKKGMLIDKVSMNN